MNTNNHHFSEEVITKDYMEFITTCDRTDSCLACYKARRCSEYLKYMETEKIKRYYYLNTEGDAVCPPKKILQCIHAETGGQGYGKDTVIEFFDKKSRYIVSESIESLYAVSFEMMEPTVSLTYIEKSIQ